MILPFTDVEYLRKISFNIKILNRNFVFAQSSKSKFFNTFYDILNEKLCHKFQEK